MVMLASLPRWTSLLVLPMLVGALLLMHGLDAHARGSHPDGASVPAATVEQHAYDEPTDHAHCAECLAGHVLAACVAVIAAIGAIGLARRLVSRGRLAALAATVADRMRGPVTLARPPDPLWVRLSVMRC